jgi:hypothetical protein
VKQLLREAETFAEKREHIEAQIRAETKTTSS